MKEYYKNIFVPKEKKLYTGFDFYVNKLYGTFKSLFISKKKLEEKAISIHNLSLEYSTLSEEELLSKVLFYKDKLKLKKVDDKTIEIAFATVIELCFRVTKKRAYVVQIMGAISIFNGYIIEMSTGEGKTLTASIAAVVLAWRGRKIHIFTSNDYLSSRDAELFEPFYSKAFVSVACITQNVSKEERKKLYNNDIVYSTAKEILADFLKDRMQEEEKYNLNTFLINKILHKSNYRKEYLLRGLDVVIVDEADSVLADDAVTPLIISAVSENELLKGAVKEAYNVSLNLKKGIDYIVEEKYNEVTLTKSGVINVEVNTINLSEIWYSKERREFLIKQAILARELFKENRQYIIKDGKVIIIDEKTGRVMEGRTWSNGLQQAIEIKEGLEMTDPTTTFSKMSFQRFFRMYKHISGMSGTLMSLKNEFWQIYEKNIIKIPTRVPSKLKLLPAQIYLNNQEKNENLISYIKEINKKELPILIGVTSIKESEELHKMLTDISIDSTVLSALHESEEAKIISKAGEKGRVTIATNMAGRGTDIHISDEVSKNGGLHVILTQKDKSKRVDLQFFGRSARGGQKGTAVYFLSLEDNIMKNYIDPKLLDFIKSNFENRMVRTFSLILYKIKQNKIEKDISLVRNKILKNEFILDDSMSYIKNSF